MRGFKTMYDYRGKVAGMITAAVGVLLVISQKLAPYTIVDSLTAEQHYYMSIWVTIAGLYFIAFGMEKHEDERVKKIRAGAMQIVLMLILGMQLAVTFTGVMIGDFDISPELLMMMLGFYLILYLVIFHVGLYTDKLWQYNVDEISVKENIKKNTWVHLLMVVVMAGILYLLMKLI